MKIFLASQDFGNHLQTPLTMVGSRRQVLFICNAKDYVSDTERRIKVDAKRAEFEAQGFEFSELDLRDYFESPSLLLGVVVNAPLIWVAGGNTFLLRRAFRYSGLDNLLPSLLNNGTVYGGSSAGAILATSTLHGVENGDDPYVVPAKYESDIIWDGLDLVKLQIVPHYKTDWFGEAADAMVDYFSGANLPYVTLRDNEVYVVDGKIVDKLT